MQLGTPEPPGHRVFGQFEVVEIDPTNDFALLKTEAAYGWPRLADGKCPYLEVSTRTLEEGEPVYSFGYPLGEGLVLTNNGGVTGMSNNTYRPRITSAIVSAVVFEYRNHPPAPRECHYVLDKSLNYGNSGGPIVAAETGKVHAFCSRFQPLVVKQKHLPGEPEVVMPSLYSVVTRLSNPGILKLLQQHGIPISPD
jgi:hypothetical protein